MSGTDEETRYERLYEQLKSQTEALQQRVQELESSLTSRGPTASGSSGSAATEVREDRAAVDRRSALRQFGTVAAAGAGAFALGNVVRPEPALADHGGSTVVMGDTNTESDASRETGMHLSPSSYDADQHAGIPSLHVQHDETTALKVASGQPIAPLVIEHSGGDDLLGGDTGALGVEGDESFSDLVFFHAGDSAKTGNSSAVTGRVLTTNFATYPAFPASWPVRGLETRESVGTVNDPGGSGPLESGEYTIDLSDELPDGTAAIVGTLTADKPQDSGYLSVWDSGDWPGTANLTYAKGQLASTLVLTEVTASKTFRLKVFSTTHVILDLQAVLLST